MWLLVLIQTLIGAKKEGDAEVYGQMPLRNSELFSWCSLTRREKCPNRKIFWSVFSCIRTEYGDLTRKSPYSVRIQENTNQNKTPYMGTFYALLVTAKNVLRKGKI